MTRIAKRLGLIVAAAFLTAAPVSPHYSPAAVLSVSLDRAEARVGRPLTPMSVAGVNRRVHRRAYYVRPAPLRRELRPMARIQGHAGTIRIHPADALWSSLLRAPPEAA